MASLVPVIHALREPVVKIFAIRILPVDQAHFPGARPMLHILLALSRGAHVIVPFSEYQLLEAIPTSDALDHPYPMLPASARKIIGYANIQDAVRAVGHDNTQPGMMEDPHGKEVVDGRHRAGHERKGSSPGQRPTVAARVRAGEQHTGRRIAANDLDAAGPFEIADHLDRVTAATELVAHCIGKAPLDRQSVLAVMRPIGVLAGYVRHPARHFGRLLRVEPEIDHCRQDLHIDLHLSAPGVPKTPHNAPSLSTIGGFIV